MCRLQTVLYRTKGKSCLVPTSLFQFVARENMICERGMTKLFSMVSLTKRDFTIGTLVTLKIAYLRQ